MKKSFLFVVMIATAAINASAQLTVYSDGKVGVGTSASDSITSPLTVISSDANGVNVQSKGRGIYAESKGIKTPFPCGVFGKASSTSGQYCTGVMGNVTYDTPQTSGKAFGVRGIAGDASMNFAVFGLLRGSNNGAGIYGTVGSYVFGGGVDGRYAGYFDGATKVKGDLTVTGSISGIILGQSSTTTAAISAMSEYNDVHTVSDKLSTLSTTRYYIDKPVEVNGVADVGMGIDIDADVDIDAEAYVDTSSAEAELSEIERLAAERVHYGIDVNTLKESFPELVYEKEDGTVAVNYMELIPVLVQAINELKNEVRVLKANVSGSNANNPDAGSTIINISSDGRYIGTKKVGNNK